MALDLELLRKRAAEADGGAISPKIAAIYMRDAAVEMETLRAENESLKGFTGREIAPEVENTLTGEVARIVASPHHYGASCLEIARAIIALVRKASEPDV